jgi:hypothetical protein
MLWVQTLFGAFLIKKKPEFADSKALMLVDAIYQ